MNKNLTIKKYIFITFEGFTFQPHSELDVPDIENMQVIGFSQGIDTKEAFNTLLQQQQYLQNTTFNEIIAMELVDGKQDVFTIQP
ncbi:hypothetical protein [Sulfurimonas sp.]|uniref:hypothetical protein n=1 Tax=Sulfurimonas sp. TaxID=2022749 RepID=UPI0025CD84DE|nr:hypothetical protein [Sulfurimonas sp.]